MTETTVNQLTQRVKPMGFFGKRNTPKTRKISSASKKAVMKKLRPLLKKVERKDTAIANISKEISKLSSVRFARASKRMKDRVKANLLAEREELLVVVSALEAKLDGYYSKNLMLTKRS